eukprot:1162154-Pelagomonas_calceolata.AAC.3
MAHSRAHQRAPLQVHTLEKQSSTAQEMLCWVLQPQFAHATLHLAGKGVCVCMDFNRKTYKSSASGCFSKNE